MQNKPLPVDIQCVDDLVVIGFDIMDYGFVTHRESVSVGPVVIVIHSGILQNAVDQCTGCSSVSVASWNQVNILGSNVLLARYLVRVLAFIFTKLGQADSVVIELDNCTTGMDTISPLVVLTTRQR